MAGEHLALNKLILIKMGIGLTFLRLFRPGIKDLLHGREDKCYDTEEQKVF